MNRSLVALAAAVSLGLGAIEPCPAQSPAGAGKAASGGATKAKAKGKRGVEEAAGPRDFTSKNFLLHTDMTAEEAKELLTRLETMLSLISKYWGRPNAKVIEMYVVKDLAAWPAGAFDPEGLRKIEEGAGVTLSRTLLRNNEPFDAKAVVYAVADRGTPQHEAVHAYCAQAFGRTGPTWYSEGMAEMGQYWRDKDPAVHCHDVVLEYLKSSPPKELGDIVAGGQVTGDSWENYAWRWALCHLLANNTNYASRFRPLGLTLLSSRPSSFEDVYGSMEKEISFEYLQFLKDMGQGYRADLCSWDWKTKFQVLRGNAVVQAKIDARRGWQASRLEAKEGQLYELAVSGEWKTGEDADSVGAGGDGQGRGKLVGVLFKDYELSEPFEIGAESLWRAPGDGKLFLRADDKWTELADNSGTLTVKIKLAANSPRN